MPIHMLTEDQALTLKDDRYEDGGGLWLIVRNNGRAASYFFEYNGKLVGEDEWKHVSLGPRKKVSLALARKRAEICRSLIERGIRPRYWRSHERKDLQGQAATDLTVADAVAKFLEFGDEKLWRKAEVRKQKRGIVRRYFEKMPIWKMLVQEVEPEHAAAVLDPIWFPKPRAGSAAQSFGYSMFKWLKLKKLYVGENPFNGSMYSAMVELLGGPQPPSHISNRQAPEIEDLPLLMAHLCTPPKHDDDVCTTKEAAEATERDPDAILRLVRNKVFPGAYKWADWEGATYLIPKKELEAGPLPLLHPLRQDDEIPVEYLALRYVLLTLVRSTMGAQLRWDQIKDRRDLVIYPKTHHKAGPQTQDEYNVIITPAVAQVLDEARAYKERHNIKSEYVFARKATRYGTNHFSDKPIGRSNCWYNFKLLMSRIPGIENPHVTLHDIRTTFITWAVDSHDYPAQHADAVLGHAIKGILNKTYFRNVKYLAQMREMKTHWEKFLLQGSVKPGDVLLPRSQATIRQFGPSTKERWNA
jgi:integrase